MKAQKKILNKLHLTHYITYTRHIHRATCELVHMFPCICLPLDGLI